MQEVKKYLHRREQVWYIAGYDVPLLHAGTLATVELDVTASPHSHYNTFLHQAAKPRSDRQGSGND